MKKPFTVLLHGPMGSGKTTVSKKLNELYQPSARVALPDVRRFVSGNHREHGNVTREVMLDITKSYLEKNIPVIIDVVCQSDYVEEHQIISDKFNGVFLPYYISANTDERWKRVCNRTADMMGVDILPQSKVDELKPIFEENQTFYNQLEGNLGTPLDTTFQSVDEIVSDFVTVIDSQRVDS